MIAHDDYTSPSQRLDATDSSPLGDYLAEAERSFDVAPLAMDHATIRRKRPRSSEERVHISPPGLATIPSRRTPEPQPSVDDMDAPEAGPSRLPLASPLRIDSPPRDEFAERFKYLVASSGLLEKTQLLSHTIQTEADSIPPTSNADSPVHKPTSSHPEHISHSGIPTELLRWDILAALAAVVAGIVYILGPKASLVPGTAFATGIALYARRVLVSSSVAHHRAPHLTSKAEGTSGDHHAPDNDDATGNSADAHDGERKPETQPESEPGPERLSQDMTGRARVMRGLEGLLDESKALDQSILAAIQILGPRPDDADHAHELRIALHRLFEDMTDCLATATSSLTTMCDRNELAVLGEMYDVQLVGGPRRRRLSSSDDEDTSPSLPRGVKGTRPRAASSGPGLSSDPLRASILSPTLGSVRTPVRGLGPSALDAHDRFTKLPNRASPRPNRTSWNMASVDWAARRQAEGDEGSDSVLSADSTESSCVPASLPDGDRYACALSPPLVQKGFPFTPKRASPLVQTLARLEMPEWSRQPPTPPFPVMNSAAPSMSPFRRSLQDIPYIPSPPVSSHEKAQNLAVARATTSMSSDKRRSLQTFNTPVVDYAREDVALASKANLTRARSLPHSDKSRTASARSSPGSATSATIPERGLKRISLLSDRTRPSTPGSGSKRTSLLFPDAMAREASTNSLGYGRPVHHHRLPSRVPSVSPLTLGGLKASYLGVHLKRRRMACCLLGLRFRESEESGYWDEVDLVLRSVMDTMSEALSRLEALRADAERENAVMHAIAAAATHVQESSPSTPPSHAIPTLLRGSDFAPRDNAEQSLLSSMDDLQRLLARVWARTDEVRSGVADGESDFAMIFADMRNDIGNMLRHVDRNRLRLEDSFSANERDATPTPALQQNLIPEFARAWEPPSPGPEEIERLVEEEEEEDVLGPGSDLPPPGLDEVFEATIPAAAAAPHAKSTLSREERIQLSKEARARGMTMAQLEGSKDPSRAAEIQRQLEAERLRAVSGEMVQELQGVFGAIRRRKGMGDE